VRANCPCLSSRSPLCPRIKWFINWPGRKFEVENNYHRVKLLAVSGIFFSVGVGHYGAAKEHDFCGFLTSCGEDRSAYLEQQILVLDRVLVGL